MSNYFFVRALMSGPWKAVDVHDPQTGAKLYERTLVRAWEEGGRWNIDNRPVLVEPGLVVSFRDYADAEWFLSQDRARWITVEPGMCLAFESQSDAEFFIRKKLGEAISEQEARAAWHAAAVAAGMDDGGADDGDGETGGDASDNEGSDENGNEGKVVTMDKTKMENKAMKAGQTKKAAPTQKKTAAKKGK